MEEARSLILRRVKVEYAPQRTASEILALAFGLLTDRNQSRPLDRNSVQARVNRESIEGSSLQEVIQ
jgi:hypothetical protein